MKKTPLYEQLAETLRDKIYEGDYTFGDSIPSERSMAAEYGISHLTVRKALTILEDEGLLVRIQGKGTFVKAPQMSANMQSLGSFSNIMRNKNSYISSKVLYSGKRLARYKYSRIFNIPEDWEVFECIKMKSSNDVPLAIEYTVVPLAYIPEILEYDFSMYSLYDIYSKYNIEISLEDQRLEIVKIYNPVAALLGKQDGDNIFLLSSYAYDSSGRIIEATRMYNNDERLIFFAAGETDPSEVKP